MGMMWVVADNGTPWLRSFDICKGDVKWVIGFTALPFRAGAYKLELIKVILCMRWTNERAETKEGRSPMGQGR